MLPRFRPLPTEKYMTKWERFRVEKGLAPRKKRSRLIYDAITKDWVPRWGPGSIKKIQEASEFIIEEKPGDIPIEKQDLFEQRRIKKGLVQSKEAMRQMKNKLKSAKVDTTEIMKQKPSSAKGKAKGKNDRGDKSALEDTLKFA